MFTGVLCHVAWGVCLSHLVYDHLLLDRKAGFPLYSAVVIVELKSVH